MAIKKKYERLSERTLTLGAYKLLRYHHNQTHEQVVQQAYFHPKEKVLVVKRPDHQAGKRHPRTAGGEDEPCHSAHTKHRCSSGVYLTHHLLFECRCRCNK